MEQQPQWNLKLWLHQVAGLHKAQMQTWMAAGIWYQMHPLWKVWRWRRIDTLSVGLKKAHCLPKTLKHELAWKKRVQPVPLGWVCFFFHSNLGFGSTWLFQSYGSPNEIPSMWKMILPPRKNDIFFQSWKHEIEIHQMESPQGKFILKKTCEIFLGETPPR